MTGDGSEEDVALGLGWSDPLGIMGVGQVPGQDAYHPVERPGEPECTCPPPGRWTLAVRHDADPFEDPDHECREPRPGIDWSEVFSGLAVWRRT